MTNRHDTALSHRRQAAWPVALLLGLIAFAQVALAVHQANHAGDEAAYACASCVIPNLTTPPTGSPTLVTPLPITTVTLTDPGLACLSTSFRYSHPVRAPPTHS